LNIRRRCITITFLDYTGLRYFKSKLDELFAKKTSVDAVNSRIDQLKTILDLNRTKKLITFIRHTEVSAARMVSISLPVAAVAVEEAGIMQLLLSPIQLDGCLIL